MKSARKHLNKSARENLEAYFPTPKEIINSGFTAARKAFTSKKPGKAIDRKKSLYALKSKEFGHAIYDKIREGAKKFPDIDKQEPFYLDLMSLVVDVPRLKQNLSLLNSSADIIRKLRLEMVGKIYKAQSEKDVDGAKFALEGRICSVVNRLGKTFKELKEDAWKLQELPNIQFGVKTVVFAGSPNVGKSTLLKRLTGARPEIAAYQFTTKTINVGYYEWRYEKIQVLDTPGLLERAEHNEIEKKALAALSHLAQVVVFIIDPTMGCGVALEEQKRLFDSISNEFSNKKFLIVVNKADVATDEQMQEARGVFSDIPIIECGEGLSDGIERLKGEIGKMF